jgi:serine/threonine protein kinase
MMGIERLLAGHLLCERYRVDAVIGRGGMGVVYRARDVRLEREVAVKVITAAPGDIHARGHLRDRFQREARAVAGLQHPNVVSVFDFGTDPLLDLDFLVLELLRGEDLASRLARSARLPVRLTLDIMVQAARGLAAGHQLGLVHRDVKPGNLFLRDTADGGVRVALLDFGIVKLADSQEQNTMTQLTAFGLAPHSPAYAAPEQLHGDGRIDAACDVWALGVTGFQMLTGEKPFSEAETRRMADGVLLRAPSARQRNPAVPESLDQLLRTTLAVHPYDRFRDARQLGMALAQVTRELGDSWSEPARSELSRPAPGPPLPPRTAAERPRWRSPFHLPVPESAPAPYEATRVLALDPSVAVHAFGPTSPEPMRPVEQVADLRPAPIPTRRGWIRRAAERLWNVALTLASTTLTVAVGSVMYSAHHSGDSASFYAALVALSLTLPWTTYRITSRRGSLALAVLGSGAAAFAALRFLVPTLGIDTTVLLIPLVQLVTAALLLRITRSPSPAPVPPAHPH